MNSSPNPIRRALETDSPEDDAIIVVPPETYPGDEFNHLIDDDTKLSPELAAKLIIQVRFHEDPWIRMASMHQLLNQGVLDQNAERNLLILLLGEFQQWGDMDEYLCGFAFGHLCRITPALSHSERRLAAKSIVRMMINGIQGKYGQDVGYIERSIHYIHSLHLEEPVAQEFKEHSNTFRNYPERSADEILEIASRLPNPVLFRDIIDYMIFNEHTQVTHAIRVEIAQQILQEEESLEQTPEDFASLMGFTKDNPHWGAALEGAKQGFTSIQTALGFYNLYQEHLSESDFDEARDRVKKWRSR